MEKRLMKEFQVQLKTKEDNSPNRKDPKELPETPDQSIG